MIIKDGHEYIYLQEKGFPRLVQELVRCKNCVWCEMGDPNDPDDVAFCHNELAVNSYVADDGFCSEGKFDPIIMKGENEWESK